MTVNHFDTDDGYLCWKYPDVAISHYHAYDKRFSQHCDLHAVIRALRPDWADCNQATTITSSAGNHLEHDT